MVKKVLVLIFPLLRVMVEYTYKIATVVTMKILPHQLIILIQQTSASEKNKINFAINIFIDTLYLRYSSKYGLAALHFLRGQISQSKNRTFETHNGYTMVIIF